MIKLARAHGLPKMYKEYSNIPKFRPIVDTTGMPLHMNREMVFPWNLMTDLEEKVIKPLINGSTIKFFRKICSWHLICNYTRGCSSYTECSK